MQHGILLFSLLGLLVATATGVFVLVNQTGEVSVLREESLVGGIGLTENIVVLKEEIREEFSEDEIQKEDQEKIEIIPEFHEQVKESEPQISVEALVEYEEIEEEKEEVQEEQIVWCEVNLADLPLQNTVIFNEVAWMGTLDSFRNEWIELKNISEININIQGWQLFDKKKDIAIIFSQEHSISPNDFFILEKTNEDVLSTTTADFIYAGVLNNTNEALYIFDEKCVLQDSVLANPDWPAGDNSSRKSMERNQDLSWYTYEGGNIEGIWGTPQKENSTPATLAPSSVSQTPSPTPIQVQATPTPTLEPMPDATPEPQPEADQPRAETPIPEPTVIPTPTSTPTPTPVPTLTPIPTPISVAKGDCEQGQVDVNSASQEELLAIKHIGEARAQDLISLRPFSSLDDLVRIKGIGEKRVLDIKEQGVACVANL